MTRKQRPRTAPATKDCKLDRRSWKTPPRERRGGHVDDPIGLEPLGDVVVAGDGDEAAGDPPGPQRLRRRRRDHPRHVAVHDAGEFVEHHRPVGRATAGQRAGQVAAKLLAVAQHVVRLDPTRRRAEADGRQQAGDLLDRAVPQPVDNRLLRRPLPRTIDAAGEHGPRDGALAAAGGPHDQPHAPVAALPAVGKIDAKTLRRPLRQRNVEHARYLLHAEGIEDRAIDRHFKRHTMVSRTRELSTTALSTPRRHGVHGVQKQKYQWVAANPVPSVLYDDEGLRMIFGQNRVAMPCSALFCHLSVFSVSPWSTSVGTAS